jgi:hypothetical protein
MKEPALVYLKILGFLIILYGPVSWFTIGLIYKPGDEYPIADIQGVVIDKNENIIVGDGFYQAILVYNKNGKFINSWKPDTQGGSFQLFLGTENSIVILPARGNNSKIYYNLQGLRINVKKDIDTMGVKYASNYKIVDNLFFPKIIKFNGRNEQVIVAQSFLKNLLKAPFPFFGLSFVLFFVYGLKNTLQQLKDEKYKV